MNAPIQSPAAIGRPVSSMPDSPVVRLRADLVRLLRHAALSKSVTTQDGDYTTAAKILAQDDATLAGDPALLAQIDQFSQKAFPVTAASLEIAEIMESHGQGLAAREHRTYRDVTHLITCWEIATFLSLALVLAATSLHFALPADSGTLLRTMLGEGTKYSILPMLLGLLGACTFILRSILNNLAAKTFVLRDGARFRLRAVLGLVLGYLVPLLSTIAGGPGPTNPKILVASFLAGFAVEPTFSALDSLALTFRDLVSRSPAAGAGGKG
ncbi:hypothetical protein [Phaeospirillum tilakii]|uniref:Uncharacterized protein n=1 Tax=Phaeospirillum tilakii TaxID=741673 RepID=A0ABW5CBV9_9PROT